MGVLFVSNDTAQYNNYMDGETARKLPVPFVVGDRFLGDSSVYSEWPFLNGPHLKDWGGNNLSMLLPPHSELHYNPEHARVSKTGFGARSEWREELKTRVGARSEATKRCEYPGEGADKEACTWKDDVQRRLEKATPF